jgi:hypothetical protein
MERRKEEGKQGGREVNGKCQRKGETDYERQA